MTIREQIEKMEKENLSPHACLSVNSKGRAFPEPQCDIRPVFQRDRDRILHSKSFRRLKNKTQVFLTPKGDHYECLKTSDCLWLVERDDDAAKVEDDGFYHSYLSVIK